METLKKYAIALLTFVIAILTLRFLKGGSNKGQAMQELNRAGYEADKLKTKADDLEAKVQELKKVKPEGTTLGPEDYWRDK
jgi:hypothetical protein